MRTSIRAVGALCVAFGLLHCGPTMTTTDTGPNPDSGTPGTDASTGTDARPGDSSTSMASRAGAACADDSMCNGLTCDTSVAGGYCSGPCMNNASQANEAMQCGGTGSTCLTSGDGAMEQSLCAKACNPASMNTGCRPGQVCTGFWASRMGGPDRAGCFPFCATNDQCPTGMMCNARTGSCGMAASNPMGLPDGSPCTIPSGMAPSPCRGICFRLLAGSNRGVCGSLINTNLNRECPDSPMEILPRAPMGDNLAYCLFRDCSPTQCCPSGLVCEGMGDMGVCVPDDPMDPNIACTAGGADAGAPPADASGPADAATGG
jgi:hypothetical protein